MFYLFRLFTVHINPTLLLLELITVLFMRQFIFLEFSWFGRTYVIGNFTFSDFEVTFLLNSITMQLFFNCANFLKFRFFPPPNLFRWKSCCGCENFLEYGYLSNRRFRTQTYLICIASSWRPTASLQDILIYEQLPKVDKPDFRTNMWCKNRH